MNKCSDVAIVLTNSLFNELRNLPFFSKMVCYVDFFNEQENQTLMVHLDAYMDLDYEENDYSLLLKHLQERESEYLLLRVKPTGKTETYGQLDSAFYLSHSYRLSY